MKFKFTKKDIVKALKTEPLYFNSFFSVVGSKEELKKCNVCAVGAVMRSNNALMNWAGQRLSYMGGHITRDECVSNPIQCLSFTENMCYLKDLLNDLLLDKNYMGALSVYFESLAWDSPYLLRNWYANHAITNNPRKGRMTARSKKNRAKVIKFVQKHFPKTITVTL